ncbi:hypothetical protein EZV62_000163 [Acer yangbiense]|uniref:Uncharacterized protein n=1 Tax=Acer yangbiense TaxID=1000413 RepID=A0A5C7IRZ3_9ROSI|nr:hypothetical protein EZV62_000163 [Acer yangbiense]
MQAKKTTEEVEKINMIDTWLKKHRLIYVDGTINLSSFKTWLLMKFDSTKDAWDYLEGLFKQSNFACRYQLEMDIRAAKQGERSIQEFFSFMTEIWDQLALMDPKECTSFPTYQKLCEERKLVEFLMALRDDFEAIKGHWKKDCPLIQNRSQDSQEGQTYSQGGQKQYPNRFSTQSRVPRPPTANTSSESKHAALSLAPFGNDNSSHLQSLVATELARILGVSLTPSASFVSNSADEPDDDVSLNTDNYVSLPFDSRPPIIRQYSHRNVQQSTSNVPPSDGSLSIDSLDVADPIMILPCFCDIVLMVVLSYYCMLMMIITGDDKQGICDLKQQLLTCFEMKDLGYLRYFLGIEVAYSPKAISFLNQNMLLMSLLELAYRILV